MQVLGRRFVLCLCKYFSVRPKVDLILLCIVKRKDSLAPAGRNEKNDGFWVQDRFLGMLIENMEKQETLEEHYTLQALALQI